jgi:hypothetical protein
MAVAGAVAFLASSATVSGAVTGALAATSTVLNLGLNEFSGARVAVDSSGTRHNGQIGSHVVLNGACAQFDKHPQGEAV